MKMLISTLKVHPSAMTGPAFLLLYIALVVDRPWFFIAVAPVVGVLVAVGDYRLRLVLDRLGTKRVGPALYTIRSVIFIMTFYLVGAMVGKALITYIPTAQPPHVTANDYAVAAMVALFGVMLMTSQVYKRFKRSTQLDSYSS